MTGYNLPDGVNTSDLPGWRPEDDEDFDPEREDDRDFDPDYGGEDTEDGFWDDEPYDPFEE